MKRSAFLKMLAAVPIIGALFFKPVAVFGDPRESKALWGADAEEAVQMHDMVKQSLAGWKANPPGQPYTRPLLFDNVGSFGLPDHVWSTTYDRETADAYGLLGLQIPPDAKPLAKKVKGYR